MKENKNLIAYFTYSKFNNVLSCSQYPNDLKNVNVTSLFMKDDKNNKSNYRPISIIPNLTKVCERLMQNQIYPPLTK